MKKTMYHIFLIAFLLPLVCPEGCRAEEQFEPQQHRVAPGESIRSLLLENNCIQTMVDYTKARDAFAEYNPSIPYSSTLKSGTTITVPTSAKTQDTPCLTYQEQKILNITFEKHDQDEQVRIYLDGPALPDIFTLTSSSPARVICDFDGVSLDKGMNQNIACNGRMIQHIRLGYEGKPFQRTRVVLDAINKSVDRVEQAYFEKERLFLLTIYPTEK